jgi:hypothetical protein
VVRLGGGEPQREQDGSGQVERFVHPTTVGPAPA